MNPEVNSFPEEFPFPYVSQWSLNLQRELPGSVLLQTGYVGSSTVKLWNIVNVNVPLPGAGAIDPRRPIQGFGNVFHYSPTIQASYHSWFVTGERRFSGAWSFISSYTLGHAIDNGKFYSESGADVQDVRNLRAERSSSNNDIRHRLVSSLLCDLPFGRGRRFLERGVTGALAGGWRLAAIASLHSGLPFTPVLSFDPTNSLAAARPDRLRDGNLPRGERTLQRFFDVGAFEAPRDFTFGNAGRNILRGPGSVNFDVGLHRSFRLGDRMRVELRAELFNAANTPQFADPGAVIGDPQAGVIQTTRARERQIQFGLKLLY